MALVFTDRRHHGVRLAPKIPERLQYLALNVELEDAAGIRVRIEPAIGSYPVDHAPAELRHSHGKIERRGTHADECAPVNLF